MRYDVRVVQRGVGLKQWGHIGCLALALMAGLLCPDPSRLRLRLLGRPAFAPEPVPHPERDAARQRFRLHVEPYRVLGLGEPGHGPQHIEEPDGLIFDSKGRLLATDAGNFRVQMWDVRSGEHLGSFGSPALFQGGEIVNLALSPDGTLLVSDEKRGRIYAFAPKGGEAGAPAYVPIERSQPADVVYKKLGGILVDSQRSFYTVDADLNDVRKFSWDGTRDPRWRFPAKRTAKDPFLRNPEGIAIDEPNHILYVASEFDYVIHLFHSDTGEYLGKSIGARMDPATHALSGKPIFSGSPSIYSGSPEGLSLLFGYLFAIDEFGGHVHVFDTRSDAVWNRDVDDLVALLDAAGGDRRKTGYLGFFGHTPVLHTENLPHKKQIRQHLLNPADYNPPGDLCSPDSVATYYDAAGQEGYIAVADQCNYRIIVYRWSDFARAAEIDPSPRR